MQPRYMLDTNTSSYVIKGNFPLVREHLLAHPMASICISAVTQAELLFGVAKKPNAERLKLAVEEFLLRVEIFPWNSAAAKSYATLRAECENKGLTLGNLDMLIAAHSLAVGAVLISNDQAFYKVSSLSLQNWTKP